MRYDIVFRSRVLTSAIFFAMTLVAVPAAHAIPALQLYSPDAIYDQKLESWVLTEGTFELWVVGNTSTSGPGGGVGDISDVILAASGYGTGDITVTYMSNGNLVSETLDPSRGGTNSWEKVTHHDEFASADDHTYYELGNLTGAPDAIRDYPHDLTDTGTGYILKIMVSISGYEAVHFDAFDHYESNGAKMDNKYTFAPYSHDASSGGGGGSAPEPGSLWMLGAGLAGLVATARRKRNR